MKTSSKKLTFHNIIDVKRLKENIGDCLTSSKLTKSLNQKCMIHCTLTKVLLEYFNDAVGKILLIFLFDYV